MDGRSSPRRVLTGLVGSMHDYDLCWINFKGSGREMRDPHPAVICKVIDNLELCIAVPLTSNLEHLKMPYTVQVNATHPTGLQKDSVALVCQMQAIDAKRIPNSTGHLEEYQIKKIKSIMKEMLAL